MNWIAIHHGIAALGDIELRDRLMEEGLAPVPVGQALEPHAGEDRLARPLALPDRLHGCPRAEREAAEVEVGQPKMGDQLVQVAGEDAAGISLADPAACR